MARPSTRCPLHLDLMPCKGRVTLTFSLLRAPGSVWLSSRQVTRPSARWTCPLKTPPRPRRPSVGSALEVIKAALGLLAGLARSSKQAAVEAPKALGCHRSEALYRLQESRRRLPQALAMAVLKDLQESFDSQSIRSISVRSPSKRSSASRPGLKELPKRLPM